MDKELQLKHYLFLGLLLFIAIFYGLSLYPLADNNEGLYAEVAREMFVTHQYIIPQLNFVPYLEKPPLFYWLLATSFHIFNTSTFAARFVPACAGFGVCLSLIFFAKQLKRPLIGWLSAVFLASSFGFILMSRIVFFDMLLTLWLTLTLICFYLGLEQQRKKYLRFAYAFLALAVLTKGLLSLVIVPLVLISYLGSSKSKRSQLWMLFDGFGILIFFAIVLPWHIIAQLQHADFFRDYFVNEQFMRFLDKRVPHDYYHGPIYYYLPRIFIYLLPWSLLIFAVIFQWCHPHKLPQRSSFHGDNNLKLFCILWFLIPLIFFSLSRAKANYYMILGLPPLALLLANWCEEHWQSIVLYRLLYGIYYTFLFILLLGIVIVCFRFITFPHPYQALAIRLSMPLLIELSTLAIISLCYLLFYHQRNLFAPVILLAALIIPLTTVGLAAGQQLQDQFSKQNLANYLKTQAGRATIYLYNDYEDLSSLPFYLAQRLTIVDSHSKDLFYGSQTPQANQWFISFEDFNRRAQQQNALIVVKSDRLDHFTAASKSMHLHPLAKLGDASVYSSQLNAPPL